MCKSLNLYENCLTVRYGTILVTNSDAVPNSVNGRSGMVVVRYSAAVRTSVRSPA